MKRLTPAKLQHLGARLATLALLLLLVAPVISQTLAHQRNLHHAHHHAMMTEAEARHSMPGMSMPSDQMSGHSQAAWQGEWQSCGYCDLLIHMPLLLWDWQPYLWLWLVLKWLPRPRCHSVRRSPPAFLWSLSRAPPQ